MISENGDVVPDSFEPYDSLEHWRDATAHILLGVEREMCPSAPKRARALLAEYREKVAQVESASEIPPLEREIDDLMESRGYYRAAGRRYIKRFLTEEVVRPLESMVEQMENAIRELERAGSRDSGS